MSPAAEQKSDKSGFRALWDFVFLSGGETIGKIGGFIAFAYLARVLSPESFGAVEVSLALLASFGLFVDFGFGPLGAKEISQKPEQTNFWARAIPGTRLVIILLCIPLMCAMAVWMKLPEDNIKLVWIMSLGLLAMIWNQSWLFQGLEKMGLVSLNQALRMMVFAAGIFIFVSDDLDLMKVGYIEITGAAAMALFFILLQRHVGVPVGMILDPRTIITLIRRAFSIGLSQAVWALNQYLTTLMVAYLIGGAAVAWYGAAHRIVNALVSYSLVYHFNLFPATAARLNHSPEAFQELVRPSARVTAWGGIAIAVAGTLMAEPICVFVYGETFSQASLSLAVLMWSLPLTLMSGHSRWALIASENQRHVLSAQSGGAITTLVTGFFFIPHFGPVGASMAVLCSHAVVWLIAHFFACREAGRIPGLTAVLRPALLALVTIYGSHYFTGFSVLGMVGGLAFFALMAPIVDNALLGDFSRLIRIKNQALAADTASSGSA